MEFNNNNLKNLNYFRIGSTENSNGSFHKTVKVSEVNDFIKISHCPKTTPSQIQPRLLNCGGATNPNPRALAAFSWPILGMFEEQTDKLLGEIQHGLRRILQTKNVYTMALHGTGMAGMSAVLDNLIETGDKILICATGFWGDVASDAASRLGADVIRKQMNLGSSFSLAYIKNAIMSYQPNMLYVINGDSSTGVYQNLDGIGEFCQKNNCLFIVDVVATIAQQPIKMDERKIDAVFSNTQKGIGCTVGLAPVSFSHRAIAKIQRRKTPPTNRTNDILIQGKVWNIEKCQLRHETFHHSLSLPLLYMLREGIADILEEGLENVWERHATSSRFLYEKAEESLGLEFFVPNPADRLQGTAVFKLPTGKNPFKIASYTLQNYHVAIAPGFGSTLGEAIRFGLFGKDANVARVEKIIQAAKSAIESSTTDL